MHLLTYVAHYLVARTLWQGIEKYAGGHLVLIVAGGIGLLLLLHLLGGGGRRYGRGYGGGWYRSMYWREKTKDLKEQRKSGRFGGRR